MTSCLAAKWNINYIAVYSAGGGSTGGNRSTAGTNVETGTEPGALAAVASSPAVSEPSALLTQRFVASIAEPTATTSSVTVATGDPR